MITTAQVYNMLNELIFTFYTEATEYKEIEEQLREVYPVNETDKIVVLPYLNTELSVHS